MDSILAWKDIPSIGGWGLFVIMSLVLLRKLSSGSIISEKIHKERLADKDTIIQIWKDAYNESEEQVNKLIGPTSAFEKLFRQLSAIEEANPNGRRSG